MSGPPTPAAVAHHRGGELRGVLLPVVCALLAGCASPGPEPADPPPRVSYPEVEQQAQTERMKRLEAEVERLRADLKQAEAALIAAESGLKGVSTRADAVSSLAEARIQVERAAASAAWRKAELREAKRKLEDADQQIQAGHFGAAMFFASRAQRIAEDLLREASTARRLRSMYWVRGARVNVRSGPSTRHSVIEIVSRKTPVSRERSENGWVLVRTPSGKIGWIHGGLLQRQ